MALAASCTHRSHVPHDNVAATPRFGYVIFPLQFGEVRRVLRILLLCQRESPRKQWTGAQFGGVSLAKESFTSFERILQKILESSGPVHILESSCGSFPQGSIESLKKKGTRAHQDVIDSSKFDPPREKGKLKNPAKINP